MIKTPQQLNEGFEIDKDHLSQASTKYKEVIKTPQQPSEGFEIDQDHLSQASSKLHLVLHQEREKKSTKPTQSIERL